MDPPHRFWNSEKLGLLQSGSWESVLLTTIPYTINDGPWHSSGWLQQLNNAKAAYLAANTPGESPLLRHLLPRIAKDLGAEEELAAGTLGDRVWGMLQHDKRLSTKGPVLALTRWYSWVDSHEHWRPLYHCRLLLMLIWSIGAGVLTKKSGHTALSLAKPVAPAGAEAKETMAEQKAKLARVQSKGKNLLHTSLLVFLNPLVHRHANCVYEALQSMRRFHGEQVKECKNPAGNVAWSVRMAAGSFTAPLAETWELLLDLNRLQKCGFAATRQDVLAAGADVDDWGPWAEQEEVWCSWLVGMLAGLTKHRLRHLCFYTFGPGLLAGLLDPEAAKQKAALASLRSLWEGYQVACQKTFPS
eukprot:2269042-Lingulodinium_polyedra.AAC.1